jgi:beta-lactamase regulating signal transducer with metallopeptidase domain
MTIDFQQLADLAWNQLWQVTLVALVVAILVRSFGQRRPHLAYLLWLLVIAKCLTPPVWSSPTGVFSWARMETVAQLEDSTSESSPAVPQVPSNDLPPATAGELPGLAEIVNETSLPSEAQSRSPRESLVALQVPREEAERGEVTSVITDPWIDHAAAPAPTSLSIPWPIALAMLWAVGAVICTATVLTKHALCAWTIWRSSEPADKYLNELVTKLSAQLGVHRNVRLMVTKRPLGPAVFGILRPTILLPQTLTSAEFAKRIEAILAHELIHFRRGDTVLGLLQTAAQILWWFHPLVWWASREATRERERCCDEEAVAGLACEPSDYAQTLLDVLRSKRKLEPVFAQPGVRPVDITARRLEHIMQADRRFHQRTPVWYWLCAALAAALLLPGGGLVIEAGAASSENEPPTEVAFQATGEWPQYGGSSYRNNVSPDTDLPTIWDVKSGKNIKWTAKLGTSVYSSPIMADGKVIIGTNNGAGCQLPALFRCQDW